MNRIFLIIILLATAGKGIAQESDSTKIALYQDARINILIKKQKLKPRPTTQSNGTASEGVKYIRKRVPGYRLQITNTIDRNKAMAAKTKVRILYPELEPYLLYQSPYFKIKVGNFKTRPEAEDYLKKLSKQFTDAIFIVHDTVEIKEKETEE